MVFSNRSNAAFGLVLAAISIAFLLSHTIHTFSFFSFSRSLAGNGARNTAVAAPKRRLPITSNCVSRFSPGLSDSLLQRYDFLVSMDRRVVRWHAFVVLRRVGGVRGLGRWETSPKSAADDVHDQQQAKQRQYRDQRDGHRAPALASWMVTSGRSVSLRLLKTNRRFIDREWEPREEFQVRSTEPYRNWTDRTASSRLRRQRVVASYRADGLLAAELPAGFATARGARVRMPSRSFRVRSVEVVGAGGTTATHLRSIVYREYQFEPYRGYERKEETKETSTHWTAAFVRLVAKGASFPASEQSRTTRRVWFLSTLAKRAVVLVHDQSTLAVQVALYFGADLFAGGIVDRQSVEGGGRLLHSSADAHWAAILVSRNLAVRLATCW